MSYWVERQQDKHVIAVIDLKMGNLGSILNMLKKIGAPAYIATTPNDLDQASKIVLPGVGAFDHGVHQLQSLGYFQPLLEMVRLQKKPVLGICLGMQLLTERSEEGNLLGLGIVKAVTKRFRFSDPSFKVPHMGWNTVKCEKPSALAKDFPFEPRFYFVHSYYVSCTNQADVLFTSHFGNTFVSGFECAHTYGVQFHPEKSHRFGMKLFQNFVAL